MGYFDEEVVLNEAQAEMQSKLLSKSGGRHITADTVLKASEMIKPEEDSGKIALKCGDCVFCVRDHVGYANYRISDRSNCPSSCALNTK